MNHAPIRQLYAKGIIHSAQNYKMGPVHDYHCLEFLLLLEKHGEANDSSIYQQASDDTHDHSSVSDSIAMGKQCRESYQMLASGK